MKQFVLTTLFAVLTTHVSAMSIQPDWFDPTQPGVGTNRYAYSFNDPVNLKDPGRNVAGVDDVVIGLGIIGLALAEDGNDLLNDGEIN